MRLNKKHVSLVIIIVVIALVLGIIGFHRLTTITESATATTAVKKKTTAFSRDAYKTYNASLDVGTTVSANSVINDALYPQLTITSVDSKNTAICHLVSYLSGSKRYVLIVPTGKGTTTIRITGRQNKQYYAYDIKCTVTNKNNVRVGADISQYQGTIDAAKLKKAGISFAIVRAGHGYNTEKNFKHFISECKQEDIDLGLYWYLTSKDGKTLITDEDIEYQADQLVKLMKANKLTAKSLKYPIYLDLEADSLYVGVPEIIKVAYVESIARKFIAVLEKAGYHNFGIYANKNYFETYLNNTYFASFEHKWYARYGYAGTRPQVTLNNKVYSPDMWQIGDHFKINGISKKRIDLDYYY